MNLRDNLVTRAEFNHPRDTSRNDLQQLSYYIVCSLTGILSGVLGVVLTIALTITVQLWVFPLQPFWPETVTILILAVSFSAGFSWGLSKLVSFILSDFSIEANGIKLMLVFATFISLLQVFLFFPQ